MEGIRFGWEEVGEVVGLLRAKSDVSWASNQWVWCSVSKDAGCSLESVDQGAKRPKRPRWTAENNRNNEQARKDQEKKHDSIAHNRPRDSIP